MKTNFTTASPDRGLSTWVINSLREKILEGEYAPGEKLDQDAIAINLNVSRTPIREALKILASEGFVEIQPYHGAFIPRFSKRDIQDVYEVRAIIESEIISQAVHFISDEGINQLEETLRREAKSLQLGDEHKLFEADLAFHAQITGYCKNRLIIEILDNLNNRILRIRSFALHQKGPHLLISHTEHEEIFQAVKLRDPDKAASLMLDHLKNSSERIKGFVIGEPRLE